MLKNILCKILKRFANLGRLSGDKRPNMAMRWFIYLQDNKGLYFVPSLGRLMYADSLEQAHKKFSPHAVIKVSAFTTFRYLMFGEKVREELASKLQMVTVEDHEGFGEDTMKITFSRTGTRIKLSKDKVSEETISKLLELIKHQNVSQTLRSNFVGISSVLKPNYTIKLYSSTKKAHIANYYTTKNKIVYIPTVVQ